MVSIIERDDKFIFKMKGLHQIWALKSKIIILKEHIIRAYQDNEELKRWEGFRVGTSIPMVLTAGTFFLKGDRNFWDVSDKKKTIIVELKDDVYNKLYLEVENPKEAMDLLNSSLLKK